MLTIVLPSGRVLEVYHEEYYTDDYIMILAYDDDEYGYSLWQRYLSGQIGLYCWSGSKESLLEVSDATLSLWWGSEFWLKFKRILEDQNKTNFNIGVSLIIC